MQVGKWRVGKRYFKATHACWYVKVVHPNGTREDHKLDPDEEKAETLYCELVTSLKNKGEPSADFGVKELAFAFLDHVQANNAPRTYDWYKDYLESWVNSLPVHIKVKNLKLAHAHTWLNAHYPATGNANTRHGAISTIQRLFNWAVDMGYLEFSPLAKLKKPAKTPRLTFITTEQWGKVLNEIQDIDPFKDLVRFMLSTGCRPQEARIIEECNVDRVNLVIYLEKVPGKKGSRTILLTDDALALLPKRDDGPLFRNKKGVPWKPNAIKCRFQRLQKKTGIKVCAYCTRHYAATAMLENGASTGAVAALLGHKDATMVLKVYGKHIDQQTEHLRKQLEVLKPR
jgi:integrase